MNAELAEFAEQDFNAAYSAVSAFIVVGQLSASNRRESTLHTA